jgi:hypothetical protein
MLLRLLLLRQTRSCSLTTFVLKKFLCAVYRACYYQ